MNTGWHENANPTTGQAKFGTRVIPRLIRGKDIRNEI